MNDTFWSFLFVALLVGMVIYILFTFWHNRKVWNNGICAKNGLAWRHIDTDSQGHVWLQAGKENSFFKILYSSKMQHLQQEQIL